MLEKAIIAGIGWLVGCFTPAVGKEVKSWFSSEGKKVVSIADAEASAAKKDIKAKL